MARAYVAFFCLAVLAIASAQEKEAEKPAAEPYDSTVVKAEGTPELPVIEFDKLPEDVKKVVGEKLVEQAMKDQAPNTISIPVDAPMSEELKNDLITLMQMKNANMIPFDLLTPESKEMVAKALYAQELEKRAKEAVVNYDSMSDEEKEHVRALFKESGKDDEHHHQHQPNLAETAAAVGGGLLGGLIAGAVGLPGATGHYGYPSAGAYPGSFYGPYPGQYPGGNYYGNYYGGSQYGQNGQYGANYIPDYHHHHHHHNGGQFGGYYPGATPGGHYPNRPGHFSGVGYPTTGINRPALGAQRPVADPVSFRMGQFGGAHQRYPYNPYSTFFRSQYQPEQYYGYRNYPYSPYNYNPYNYPYPYYPY